MKRWFKTGKLSSDFFWLFPVSVVLSFGAPLGWILIEKFLGSKVNLPVYRKIVLIYMGFATLAVFVIFASLAVYLMERLRKAGEELAKLKESYEKEYVKLKEKMLELSSSLPQIGASKDEEEVYYRVAEITHMVVGLERVLVFKRIVDETGEAYIQLVEARGVKADKEVKEYMKLIPCDEKLGSIGIACRTGAPVLYDATDILPERYRIKPPFDKLEIFRTKAFIVVPIKIGRDVIALIAGDRKYSKGGVSRDDLVIIQIIAEIAGNTIESIRNEAKLEELARFDSLSGLYNRGYWFELADKEYKKAVRYDLVFALIIIDIDDFKRVNDTFGHQTGDMVIRDLGSLIKDNIRYVDIPGRYGGEEFILLLPLTDERGAVKVAERLRAMVESTHLGIDRKITITCGVVGFDPLEKPDFKVLLMRADEALYHGKKLGKNRVISYSEVRRLGQREIQKL